MWRETINRLRVKLNDWRARFWAWLYDYARQRVGPEAEEYWDELFWSVFLIRLGQIGKMGKVGQEIVKVLVDDAEEERRVREARLQEREVRDR